MGRNQNDESLVHKGADDAFIELPVISNITENPGSANVTISNIAPSGVTTATISKWLNVNLAGVTYYIPMWT